MAATAQASRTGQTLRKGWVALSSFTITFFLCEMAIRFLGLSPEVKVIELASDDCVYQRSTNAVLGFELKQNYTHENPDFIESYERTNSHGQRDIERSFDKPAGRRRVILLGDSVVEGYGLAESDTISGQLEALYPRRATQVLNFGVSAYCTLAEVELLATKGVLFAPDVVVLVFVENDFDNFNREAFSLGQTIDRPALVEWLFKRSHLFRLAATRFDLFQFRAHTDPARWNHEAIGDDNVAVGIKRFRKLADEHNFQPLIAIWPRFLDDRVADVHHIPDSDQLIVEALAAQNQLPTFRLSPYYQAAIENETSDDQQAISPRLKYSQGDELHPSAMGALVAAKAIYSVLNDGIDQLVKNSHSAVDDQGINSAIRNLEQREPNYARVYNRIGNDHFKRGDFTKAIEQYERALNEDANNAATHNNLGIALQRAGKEGAIEEFRKAIESRPGFAEAHFNLGAALEKTDPTKAQDQFIQAVQLQPDFVQAHFSLSRSLLRDGRPKAAEAGLRQVLKFDRAHEQALLTLANELARQNRFSEARGLFEEFIVLRPNHAEALNNLGVVCSAAGDAEIAIEYFRSAVRADPNHPRAGHNLKNLLDGSNLAE